MKGIVLRCVAATGLGLKIIVTFHSFLLDIPFFHFFFIIFFLLCRVHCDDAEKVACYVIRSIGRNASNALGSCLSVESVIHQFLALATIDTSLSTFGTDSVLLDTFLFFLNALAAFGMEKEKFSDETSISRWEIALLQRK